MDIVLYALTALLYGGLAVAGWRSHRQAALEPVLEGAPSLAAGGNLNAPVTAPRSASIEGTLLRGAARRPAVGMSPVVRTLLFVALSAMFWLGVGIYWIESFFFPLDGLRLLVLPLTCVASLLPLVFGGVHVLSYAAAPLFKLHFLIANVAYGLFVIAALHAVLMLLVERRLHAMRGRGGVP